MGVSAGDIRARARVLLEETFPLETLQWVVQATLTHLWWGVSSGRLCRSDHKCFTNWQSWWDCPPCPALPVSLSNQFPYWRHTERATVVLSVSVIVNWVKIPGGGAGEGCTRLAWPAGPQVSREGARHVSSPHQQHRTGRYHHKLIFKFVSIMQRVDVKRPTSKLGHFVFLILPLPLLFNILRD